LPHSGNGYIAWELRVEAGWEVYFSHTELLFDRFHVKMGLNKTNDKVRKAYVGQVGKLKNKIVMVKKSMRFKRNRNTR